MRSLLDELFKEFSFPQMPNVSALGREWVDRYYRELLSVVRTDDECSRIFRAWGRDRLMATH